MYNKLDTYDTLKLQEALRIINEVYEYNFDSSPQTKKLGTVMCKLITVMNDHGDKDVIKDGFINS